WFSRATGTRRRGSIRGTRGGREPARRSPGVAPMAYTAPFRQTRRNVAVDNEFPRIKRLPPYVFAIVNELKMEQRRRGEDIIDFGMGNPDRPPPRHVVDKLIEAASRRD